MEKSVVEIIDTTIKIGLGSFIGLLGTYLMAKLNHTHEYKKDKSKRFLDSLEVMTLDIEDYTHILSKYLIYLSSSVDNRALLESDKFKEIENECFNKSKNLIIVESKLKLMNLAPQAKLVFEFSKVLDEILSIHLNSDNITKKNIENKQKIFWDKRVELFDSLIAIYS